MVRGALARARKEQERVTRTWVMLPAHSPPACPPSPSWTASVLADKRGVRGAERVSFSIVSQSLWATDGRRGREGGRAREDAPGPTLRDRTRGGRQSEARRRCLTRSVSGCGSFCVSFSEATRAGARGRWRTCLTRRTTETMLPELDAPSACLTPCLSVLAASWRRGSRSRRATAARAKVESTRRVRGRESREVSSLRAHVLRSQHGSGEAAHSAPSSQLGSRRRAATREVACSEALDERSSTGITAGAQLAL